MQIEISNVKYLSWIKWFSIAHRRCATKWIHNRAPHECIQASKHTSRDTRKQVVKNIVYCNEFWNT